MPARKGAARELPPDWFCEGQQDLLDELTSEPETDQKEEEKE